MCGEAGASCSMNCFSFRFVVVVVVVRFVWSRIMRVSLLSCLVAHSCSTAIFASLSVNAYAIVWICTFDISIYFTALVPVCCGSVSSFDFIPFNSFNFQTPNRLKITPFALNVVKHKHTHKATKLNYLFCVTYNSQ